ncbi:hypothetical protein HanRHA438_Chr16g0742921 [Helianthus annuus]|nr:hypothetical protein HanOQP8_Chr16g0603241 [Helianthus annuus]KAJ0800761.1 hypothetical protein HanPI659440_Chr03g0108981 [Helianthus annuus]KAJ0834371.1 hypothetical protein HanRHA438_Chr16g0742921 [Helianthus annuus]
MLKTLAHTRKRETGEISRESDGGGADHGLRPASSPPVTHLVGDDRSRAARRRGFPATSCSVVKGWSRQQRTTEPLLCFDDTPLPTGDED